MRSSEINQMMCGIHYHLFRYFAILWGNYRICDSSISYLICAKFSQHGTLKYKEKAFHDEARKGIETCKYQKKNPTKVSLVFTIVQLSRPLMLC